MKGSILFHWCPRGAAYQFVFGRGPWQIGYVTKGSQNEVSTRFIEALRRIDAENSRDPNQVDWDGQVQPRELCYSRWLTAWVLRLCPEASESLLLAAYTQHICRWEIPRSSYPMNRAGYLKWREDLKKFHAKKSEEVLLSVGYPGEVVSRVQELNLKRGLGRDPEMQVLEDALCLVFLEHQLADLANKTPEDQVVNAIQKSWTKMSLQGRQFALGISLQGRERELVKKAVSTTS